MKRNESQEKDLEFVGRQLASLVREGRDPSLIMQTLETSAGARYKNTVSDLNKLLAGQKIDGASPGVTHLGNFLIKAKGGYGEKLELVARYFEAGQIYRKDFKSYVSGLKSSLGYNSALLGVGFVITYIYSSKVLVNMIEVYEENGQALPEFTAFMNDYGIFVVYGLLIASFAFIGIIHTVLQFLSRSTDSFSPSRKLFGKLGVVRELYRLSDEFLYMAYIYVFKGAGLSDSDAFKLSAEIVTENSLASMESILNQETAEKLNYAHKLDVLDQELEFQLNHKSSDLIDDVIFVKAKINIPLHILVGVVIGAIVVSFYLPIFMLGTVF